MYKNKTSQHILEKTIIYQMLKMTLGRQKPDFVTFVLEV